MTPDDLELFLLFMGEDTVNHFLNLDDRRFAMTMHKGRDIKMFSRMLQQLRCDDGCALAKHITEHDIQLKVTNSRAFLGTIFLPGHIGRQFDSVPAEIPKLTNVFGRNEAAANKIMLKQIELCVFFVVFPSIDCFYELWIVDYHMTGFL